MRRAPSSSDFTRLDGRVNPSLRLHGDDRLNLLTSQRVNQPVEATAQVRTTTHDVVYFDGRMVGDELRNARGQRTHQERGDDVERRPGAFAQPSHAFRGLRRNGPPMAAGDAAKSAVAHEAGEDVDANDRVGRVRNRLPTVVARPGDLPERWHGEETAVEPRSGRDEYETRCGQERLVPVREKHRDETLVADETQVDHGHCERYV